MDIAVSCVFERNFGDSQNSTATEMIESMTGSARLAPAAPGSALQCANQAAPRARHATFADYTTRFAHATYSARTHSAIAALTSRARSCWVRTIRIIFFPSFPVCSVVAPTAHRAHSRNQPRKGEHMAFYEKGPVRIHYQEAGSGFPLLVLPGGGQNSTIGFMSDRAPFNAIEEFKDEYRCITADLRNAPSGQSSGPLEIDRPWDSYADDHLALMDHLGIRRFMVIGYCIGGPFIWKLIERAPERIVAAIVSQPVGFRRESNPMYDNSMQTWGPALVKQRPDLTMETIDKFLTRMYVTDADFVFSVPRHVVKGCPSPVLVMPDETPSHPYEPAIESAMLAPRSELTFFPWKDTEEKIPLAVRHVRTFLKANRPPA